MRVTYCSRALLLLLALSLVWIWGCRSHPVSVGSVPCGDHEFHFLSNLMKVHLGGIDPLAIQVLRENNVRIPDRFGFEKALKAYCLGLETPCSIESDVFCRAMMSCASTNLSEQAFLDGIVLGKLRTGEVRSSMEIMMSRREAYRMNLQKSYWRYRQGMKSYGPDDTEIPVGKFEEGGDAFVAPRLNLYDDMWSAYQRGYLDAYCLFEATGRFPISTASSCLLPDLDEQPDRRAYVYGWWAAGIDFFEGKSGDGFTAYLHCIRAIRERIALEVKFQEYCKKASRNFCPSSLRLLE